MYSWKTTAHVRDMQRIVLHSSVKSHKALITSLHEPTPNGQWHITWNLQRLLG
jgi:hypothetical protein